MLLLFWTLSSGFGIGAGGVICAVILGVIKLARMAHQQREALMAEYQLWREDMTILRSGRADNQHWEEWIAKGQNLIRKLEGYGLGSKETYEERRRLAAHIRDDIRAYGAARVASAASLQHPPSITELARLRNNGLISADEFRAFSERLSTTPGERATDIIAAIERLYREHKKGAMTEGNYHAGLWALLDRLDRDARRRS
jgi:Asp-tRNA(Asn)/Glu-tRNA(Gln) amidotransferase B subunit